MADDLPEYYAKTSFEKRMAIIAVGARWLISSTDLIDSTTRTERRPLLLARAKNSSDEAKLESVPS